MTSQYSFLFGILFVGNALVFLGGCNLLLTYPKELDQQQRFQQIPAGKGPVKQTLTIHWDKHAIPFVEAENNHDLAFGVGVTHAHLRLGQLELQRIISQGRLQEITGPIPQVSTADHGLRMLNLCASGQKAWQAMPTESKEWVENYTKGINWYMQNMTMKPVEYDVFGMKPKPFSISDVLCISRLVSADLTWVFYLKFLRMAERPNWQQALAHSLSQRVQDTASYHNDDAPLLSKMLTGLSKSGSNSLVIGKDRSTTGGALIANDPHVGLLLPNFWLMMGMKSPDLHAFGLMIPGVPVIGVGRNPHVAWGGTNMRGISSHLIDVSQLDKAQIKERREVVKRRWWFNKEIVIRETPHGPIFTDLPLFNPKQQPYTAALDWIGHRGSDEIGAFLSAAKSTHWDEFRQSFSQYYVSAFNILYADKAGNIGMIPAYGQPVLKQPEQTLELVKPLSNTVQAILSPVDQPNPYNPPQGYLSSANNKPFSNPQIPYGFSFSNSDRVERMQALVESSDKVGIEELKRWQLDTYSHTADRVRRLLVENVSVAPDHPHITQFQALVDWDGRFMVDSRGAAVFETLTYFAWQDCIKATTQDDTMRAYLKSIDNWKPEFSAWLQKLTQNELDQHMASWLEKTAKALAKDAKWGDLQRQVQTSALGVIPVIGRRFRQPSYPGSGSNDTLFKAGRRHGPQPQDIFYGSSARHISDMATMDENYFVLHGGQDGWLMSPNLADQTDLWRQGKYVKIPLTMSKVQAQFNSHKTVITPESL